MASLQELAEALLERWKQEMRRLPLPVHVQVAEGEAAERMARLGYATIDVLEGEEAAAAFEVEGEAYAEAGELGRLRKRQGFSIEELVQEHIILRNEFWTLFKEQVYMNQVIDFRLEKRVNGCFDAVLQAAASAYHYECSREIMENPLRDPETSLYNRSYFHGRLIEELRRSVRYGHEITLVLFEMSNLARVQEAEGPENTLRMLKAISADLVRMTRDCDVVARLGEGNFAALLPETGWRGGQVMSERLCRYFLRELPPLATGGAPPEMSWGLASFPEEVSLPEKLYACAVEAMRQSRDLPPDEVAIYRGSGTGEGA